MTIAIAIVDRDHVGHARALIEAAAPGTLAIQLRDRGASAQELIVIARALVATARPRAVRILINDRVDVAHAAQVDGVQLPEHGLGVREARAILGAGAWIGRSCHDREGLERASEDGADFALLSPLHAVAGKNLPLGHGGFAAAIAGCDLPVYALGAVTRDDLAALRSAGAAGVATIRSIGELPDWIADWTNEPR